MDTNQYPRATQLFRSTIEHIEVSYLKAIAEGPGYPAYTIFDLTDPCALERVRRLQPEEAIRAAINGAAERGVMPITVYEQVLCRPYHEPVARWEEGPDAWFVGEPIADAWWKDTPPGYFPIALATAGQVVVTARLMPVGTDEALRRRMAVEYTEQVVRLARDSKANGHVPVVITIADVGDPRGREVAEQSVGLESVEKATEAAERARGQAFLVWAGVPTSPTFPDAWGGSIPSDHVAVRVLAYGGRLNTTVAVPAGF